MRRGESKDEEVGNSVTLKRSPDKFKIRYSGRAAIGPRASVLERATVDG
jgi:hypothetical protein